MVLDYILNYIQCNNSLGGCCAAAVSSISISTLARLCKYYAILLYFDL